MTKGTNSNRSKSEVHAKFVAGGLSGPLVTGVLLEVGSLVPCTHLLATKDWLHLLSLTEFSESLKEY